MPELFPDVPIINLFESYYHPGETDLGFRPEFPITESGLLRSRVRNGMILLDLEYCRAGYAPHVFNTTSFPRLIVTSCGFYTTASPAISGIYDRSMS